MRAEPSPPAESSVATALPELSESPSAGKSLFELPELSDLNLAIDVPLGSVELDLRGLLGLSVGSVLKLEHLTGEPLDVTANGTPIARGEVRIHGEHFAVRITEILNAVEVAVSAGGEGPTHATQGTDS